MKDLKPILLSAVVACLLLPLFFLLPGCSEEEIPPLQMKDLDESELRFVTRLVVLERAKAVALIDRTTGDALLDSLSTAWGDSAMSETALKAPISPKRAAQVGDLLNRILDAELDSLVQAPRADRLAATLPDPLPVVPEPAEQEKPAGK